MTPVQYNTRKSIAKGMLDVALLLSNVSRMKRMLVPGCIKDVKCIVGTTFLSISIILQIAVGIMLIKLGILEQRGNKRKVVEYSDTADTGEKLDEENSFIGSQNGKRGKPRTRTLLRQRTIEEQNLELERDKSTMNLNTGVMIIVFIIVVLNIVIDGMDLSSSPVTGE